MSDNHGKEAGAMDQPLEPGVEGVYPTNAGPMQLSLLVGLVFSAVWATYAGSTKSLSHLMLPGGASLLDLFLIAVGPIYAVVCAIYMYNDRIVLRRDKLQRFNWLNREKFSVALDEIVGVTVKETFDGMRCRVSTPKGEIRFGEFTRDCRELASRLDAVAGAMRSGALPVSDV
jgi:hypothetical protein